MSIASSRAREIAAECVEAAAPDSEAALWLVFRAFRYQLNGVFHFRRRRLSVTLSLRRQTSFASLGNWSNGRTFVAQVSFQSIIESNSIRIVGYPNRRIGNESFALFTRALP
jgi:hypothetical protein